jgi:hypothetical protein
MASSRDWTDPQLQKWQESEEMRKEREQKRLYRKYSRRGRTAAEEAGK